MEEKCKRDPSGKLPVTQNDSEAKEDFWLTWAYLSLRFGRTRLSRAVEKESLPQ